ncbi:MAG: hypothetical protein AABX79_00195 [Nanoarchaeota archaeon]
MKLGLRMWILIIVLFLALLAIAPWKFFSNGVLIKSVEANSSAFEQGLRQGQVINSIDGKKVESIDDFSEIMGAKNFSVNNSIKTIIGTNQVEFILFSNKVPKITVSQLSNSNLKTGLDLSGGSRAIVKAEDKDLSRSEMNDLISMVSNRLNVYGIADVQVSSITDLSGKNFMMVEIAGATPKDLSDLISQQGKFEAKIGNETVFIGGEEDITSTGESGQDSVIECPPTFNGFCNFRFTIFLSPEAAQRQAQATKNLTTDPANPQYLSEKLYLYIDDRLVNNLSISTNLKGRAETQISIEGSGSGSTLDEAYNAAQEEMKELKTILKTGSLPYKLKIEKLDTISPNLGKEFTKNIIFLGLMVFLIISAILFIKYRKIKITLSVIMTMFSEAFITLGIAALIGWNLDAPSIAGIIAGMGTGVNDQIVIIDESVSNKHLNMKDRIKRALFIIFGAFFTIIAAMLPLFWAGAGMLKGFALTTIIGVSVGILITRPAFASIIRKMEE